MQVELTGFGVGGGIWKQYKRRPSEYFTTNEYSGKKKTPQTREKRTVTVACSLIGPIAIRSIPTTTITSRIALWQEASKLLVLLKAYVIGIPIVTSALIVSGNSTAIGIDVGPHIVVAIEQIGAILIVAQGWRQIAFAKKLKKNSEKFV